MRRIVYDRFGPPAEVLRVAEEPSPEPGPGQAVVRLEAAPVHLADLKNVAGLPWFDRYKPPATPGFEGVGRVVRLGTGVTSPAVGARVFLPMGYGAWVEERALDAATLRPAPEGIDAVQLCLAPINLQTAWLMLKRLVPLGPGDWVIQNAANSNVGYYLIRLARQWGLRTVNVVRRDGLAERLTRAGADIVLRDGDDLPARVAQATAGGLVRLGIDAVSGEATGRIAQCLGEPGLVAVYGLLTGQPCMVRPELLMFRDVTVEGFMTNRATATMSAAEIDAMWADMTRFLTEDPPQAAIAATYGLDQVKDAVIHAARTEEGREGKVVLLAG